MLTLLSDWTILAHALGALLAVSVGIFRWFHLTLSLKILLIYICLLPFWDVFNILFLEGGANDVLALNVIRILEMITLGLAYILQLPEGTLKKITLIISGGAVLFGITNLLFLQGSNLGNTFTQYLAIALSLYLGLAYIHSYEFEEGSYRVLLTPWFILSMAVIAVNLSEVLHLWLLNNQYKLQALPLGTIVRSFKVVEVVFLLFCVTAYWRQVHSKETSSSTWLTR
ncbi:MAG: hypothetical protein AAFQ98_21425 [Bacteroidota bacterium]